MVLMPSGLPCTPCTPCTGEELSAVPWTQLGWTGIAYQSASPPVVINSKAQAGIPMEHSRYR